jgi:hypothetical protein
MVKSTNHEVLLVLPTVNAFYRKERIGIMELLKQAAEREHGVNVRILTPTKDTIEEKLQNISSASELPPSCSSIILQCPSIALCSELK